MLRTTPQEIAKYFQESVSFDFKRENISSFQQIESAGDDFYALTDKEAFSALLNDFLGYDNQLEDIFRDIFDSELGIHCFANKAARNSPRSRITYFLNKYTYHQNDIAKVYLAFNTWLVFFGCGMLSPDWTKCPFCGGTVKAGTNGSSACTNKSCKKTTADFMGAASELATLLAEEQSGKATPTPRYWDAIKERAEFYTEYKLPIEKLRSSRVHEEQLKTEKQKKEAIDLAVKELNKISALLVLEVDKQSPDFEAILKLIAQNPQINEANKYNDASFAKKVAALTDLVAKKKAEVEKVRAEAQDAMEFSLNVKKFLELQSLLEQELVSESKPFEEFKSLFEELDGTYNRVSAGRKSGYKIDNSETIEAIKKYETTLRTQFVEYVSQKEHAALITKKQSELITKVNVILNSFNGVQAEDDKSAQIAETFNKEIEMNKYFDDYRIECRTQYLEITNSVRVALSELIKSENEVKIADFKRQAEDFIAELDKTQPSQMRSGVFNERLNTIKSTKYYDSIRTNGEYIRNINIISEKITILENDEKAYNADMAAAREAKLKRRRRFKKAMVAFTIVLMISAISFVTCELAGILPINFIFPDVSPELKGEVVDDGIVLNSSESFDKNLIIPESARLAWQFEEHKITEIGDDAFSNSSVVETVYLPKTIEKIGGNAFSSCSKLRRIILSSSVPPKIAESTFANSNITFYVPKDNYDAYLQDEMWGQYSEKIFPHIVSDLEKGMVILDSNGGSQVDSINDQVINSTLGTLPVPEKYGHVFTGWYYHLNGEDCKFEPSQTLFTESIKLYAKWEIGDYIVSFDYQGGREADSQKIVTYNSTYGELPTTNKTGYTFEGWYLDNNLITDLSTVDISSDVTLVAKWTPNKYNISFEYNGGDVGTEEKNATFDSTYGELPTTKKNGYIFLGWYFGDVQITNTTTVSISNDHTLEAKWKPIQYKVSYVLNGGNLDCSEFFYDFDEQLSIATPHREGYTFQYWVCNDINYTAGATVSNLSNKDGDVLVFTAVWNANINRIVYDANGGVGTMQPTDLATDATINLSKNIFIRDGYVFKGWGTSSNGSIEYYDEAVYTMSSQTTNILYAIWEANTNKITLNYVIGTEVLESRDIFVKTGESVVLDNTFTRDGYTMIGWCAEIGGDAIYQVDSQYTMAPSNLMLYTIWSPNVNRIVFDANGGDGEMSAVNAKTDEVIDLPLVTFSNKGFTFAGWSTSANGSVEFTDGVQYTMGANSEYILYAIWTKDVYNINYVLNGGVNHESNPNNYGVDSDNIVLLPPTRSGYTFEGWYSDEALTIASSEIPKGSAGELVFYAKWKANTNTLHFNSNGGTGTMVDIYVDTDAIIYLPDNQFTKLGYTFIGWKKTADEDEGATYSNNSSYIMGEESEYTLYAVWALNTYSIHYELNGGTNEINNPNHYTIESGDITVLDPYREGYTFGGWFTDISLTTESNFIASGSTGNFTFYAKWIANVNTLMFDANGGSGTMNPIEVNTDEVITLPANSFTRPGYVFVGWKITNNPEEGATYTNADSYHMGASSEYVLYATWSRITYSIVYDLNGGVNNGQNPFSYTVESGNIEILEPTRTGYTFVDWYSDESLTIPSSSITEGSVGNRTFYAKWKANTNTIVFNANGGTGTMNNQSATTGSTITLQQNMFYKEGFKFAGWSTVKGSASVYSDQSAYTMGAESSVTLYAVWSQTQFTIQYNLDGGTNSTANPAGYNSEAATIVLAAPTKTGNTFAGWYTDSTFTKKITQIPTGSSSNFNLYAKWTKNSYTVTFNYNGGTGSTATKTVTYSEAYGSLPTPNWVGHTFLGWYYNDSRIDADSIVILTADHTLVAKWSTNKYTISFNFDGGTGDTTTKDILYGSNYGTLPTATKVGHTFDGWYYNNSKVTSSTTMNVADSHILVAKWTKNVYTVTFDYNGGTGSTSTKKVTYSDAYGTLPTATKEGHTFGWYYGNTLITDASKVSATSDHTLVAKWTPINYILYIEENNVNVTVIRNDTNQEVSSGSSIPYGTSLSISCTTNSGYNSGWCSPSGTTTMPASNLTITSGATKNEEKSCLAKGTLILLPDGSTVPIESLQVGDPIMTYDHITGKLVESVVGYVYYDFDEVYVINLDFTNDISLKFVNTGHGLYDLTLDKYVLITPQNAQQYIGHKFAYFNSNMEVENVELIEVTVSVELIERYDIVSANSLNHIANGMLACSDTLVGFSNTFEFDALVYDIEQMDNDIATYGLYSYDEWSQYVTYEEFIAFNGQYFKIAIAKGLITEEELFSLINDIQNLWS